MYDTGTPFDAEKDINVLTNTLHHLGKENKQITNLRHLIESDPELEAQNRKLYSIWMRDALYQQKAMKTILADLRAKIGESKMHGKILTVNKAQEYQTAIEDALTAEANKTLSLIRLREALLTEHVAEAATNSNGGASTEASKSVENNGGAEVIQQTATSGNKLVVKSKLAATTVASQTSLSPADRLILEAEEEIRLSAQEDSQKMKLPSLLESDIDEIQMDNSYGQKRQGASGPIAVRERLRSQFGHRFNPEPWTNVPWVEPTILSNCWVQAMMAGRYQFSPSCQDDGTFYPKQCFLER